MAGAKPGVHKLQLKPIIVPQALQDGDKFIKWDEDGGSCLPVTLKVDPGGHFLYWTNCTSEAQDTEMLDIVNIRDVRTGKYAKLPKDSKLRDNANLLSPDTPLDSKSITVVYGNNFVDLVSYCFVAQRPDIAKLWGDEVMSMAYNLLALNASPVVNMRKAFTKMHIAKDKNGMIPVKNIVRVFARHSDDKRRVEQALEQSGLPTGKNKSLSATQLTWDVFLLLYGKLTARAEVEKVFCTLTNQSYSPSKCPRPMTADQLVVFLNDHQRDPRLNEILYPYADHGRAKDLIALHEPHKQNVIANVLSCEGFLQYLLGDDNLIVALDKLDLSNDMDKPLSHYFINSSHNTYLIGHQFTGRSSVEMYRQCLLAGCRCVELDLWNGRIDEPVVMHGYTLVPEISAREVLEAIAEAAFKTSEWPVILSFENHCNPRQQAKIAQYCREFFGDMMLDVPLESHPLTSNTPLPSPSQLKHKILIKNKKKHRTHKKKEGGNVSGLAMGVAMGVGVGVGESQFHVDLNQCDSVPLDDCGSASVAAGAAGTGGAAAAVAVVVVPALVVQSDGDAVGKSLLQKDPSHESSDADTTATVAVVEEANGEIPEAETAATAATVDDDSSSSDEEETLYPDRTRSKDTSAEEVEAGAEISELVNYVQPVHFNSFEVAEKRNRSYEMSSFVENHTLTLLKENPVEFVNYNKRQLARVYPRGTRVDSSNFLPHQFWNAGCQLVALNYQTLDLSMQLNIGLFENNNRSGYLLKPDFMIRPDRRFDPFAESTVDGIIAGTVTVKVLSGQFLCDKRTGCFVEVEMYGLPADTVRKRFKTKTVANNCINPVWDEDPFVFKKVVLPELATLRIAAYEDSSNKPLLGHRVLSVVGLRPGYKHIGLRNEAGQPLGLSTLFVYIKVGDYVPDGLSDFAEALVNPIKYQSELEKRAQQLSVFDDDNFTDADEEADAPGTPVGGANREGGVGSTGAGGADRTGDREVSRSNGDVMAPSSDSAQDAYLRRQNSTHKTQMMLKGSEDKTNIEISISALETIVLEAENLEKINSHKTIREKKLKIEKELLEIRKKHKKERVSLASGVDKKKKELTKQHSKLEKKMSSTKSISEESSPPGRLSSDHHHKLEEVSAGYQTSLHVMVRGQLEHEKRTQERHQDLVVTGVDKLMRASQAAQQKVLLVLHDRSVDDLKKKQDGFIREERKVLTKNTTDKQELERKRREMRQALVARGIQERQRLTDIFEKKKDELEKRHEVVRRNFEEERGKEKRALDEDYDGKLSDIAGYAAREFSTPTK